MQKYQQYYQEMAGQNKEIFAKFKAVHDKFGEDNEKWKKEFNKIGSEVVNIIREWEGRLCLKSQGGRYGKYASNLADKFWGEVRKNYSLIDLVGVS